MFYGVILVVPSKLAFLYGDFPNVYFNEYYTLMAPTNDMLISLEHLSL